MDSNTLTWYTVYEYLGYGQNIFKCLQGNILQDFSSQTGPSLNVVKTLRMVLFSSCDEIPLKLQKKICRTALVL
jgi:hypothetical protein